MKKVKTHELFDEEYYTTTFKTHYPTWEELQYLTNTHVFKRLTKRSKARTKKNMRMDLKKKKSLQHTIVSYHIIMKIALHMDVRQVLEQAKRNSVFYMIVHSDPFWKAKLWNDFSRVIPYRNMLMRDLECTLPDWVAFKTTKLGGLISDLKLERTYTGAFGPSLKGNIKSIFPMTPFRRCYYILRPLVDQTCKDIIAHLDPIYGNRRYTFNFDGFCCPIRVKKIYLGTTNTTKTKISMDEFEAYFLNGTTILSADHTSCNTLWCAYVKQDAGAISIMRILLKRGYYHMRTDGVIVI